MIFQTETIPVWYGAVAGLTLFWQARRKKSKNPYPEALHLLLAGNQTEAITKLRETVRQDTDNITAYILLGDLYRDSGETARAVKIHRNLLVRSDISDPLRIKIRHHLVLDYKEAGEQGRAIATAEELFKKDKKNADLQALLLDLYIHTEDWDKAFFHQQALNRWQKARNQNKLALIKVQSGLALTRQNAEHEGRIRFREAIKIDKKCVSAHLYLGDSYRRDGRHEEALTGWENFARKQPANAHFVFTRLESVLFDLGRYSEIESIYHEIAGKKVSDETVYMQLIALYIKQGKISQAAQLHQERIERNPDSVPYRLMQIQLLSLNDNQDKALKEAMILLKDTISRQPVFRCNTCGIISDEPLWYCPQCHQWNSYTLENE